MEEFWNPLGRKEIYCRSCVQARPVGLGWTQPRSGELKEGIWVNSDNMHKKIFVSDIRDRPGVLE